MPRSPEAKIHILGKEVDPRAVGTGGLFLALAGGWFGNYPCLALPALIVGLGAMAWSIRGIEKQEQKG